MEQGEMVRRAWLGIQAGDDWYEAQMAVAGEREAQALTRTKGMDREEAKRYMKKYRVTQREVGEYRADSIERGLQLRGEFELLALFQLIRNYAMTFYRSVTPKRTVQKHPTEYQWRALFAVVVAVLYHEPVRLVMLFPRQVGKSDVISLACSVVTGIVILGLLYDPNYPENSPTAEELQPVLERLGREFYDGFRLPSFAPGAVQNKEDLRRIRDMITPFMSAIGEKLNPPPMWTKSGEEARQIARKHAKTGLEKWLTMDARTSDPGAKTQEGGTGDALLLEEFQDIQKSVFENKIQQVLDSTSGPVLIVGTLLEEEVTMLDEVVADAENHTPHLLVKVDAPAVVRARFQDGVYERTWKSRLATYGENHPMILTKYLHKRPALSDMVFTARTWITHLMPSEGWCRRVRDTSELTAIAKDVPENVVLVAGNDIAKTSDSTVLKLGWADWRDLKRWLAAGGDMRSPDFDGYYPALYEVFTWSVQGDDYPSQAEDLLTLWDPVAEFLLGWGLDVTGDRGDMENHLGSAGVPVIPFEFTAGNDVGKSQLSKQFREAVLRTRYRLVTDERYCGTMDWVASGQQTESIGGDGAHYGDPEYHANKRQDMALIKRWSGQKLNIEHKDARRHVRDNHDDHGDAEMLLVHAGLECEPSSAQDGWQLGTPRQSSGLNVSVSNSPRGAGLSIRGTGGAPR